jgi:hypothetical protein
MKSVKAQATGCKMRRPVNAKAGPVTVSGTPVVSTPQPIRPKRKIDPANMDLQ